MEMSLTSLSLCLQGVTVMVQGQGQTTGQLQVIPHGVTVIPAAGQQLMQAVLPNGQVQRFLFTPTSASPSTPGTRGFDYYTFYRLDQLDQLALTRTVQAQRFVQICSDCLHGSPLCL